MVMKTIHIAALALALGFGSGSVALAQSVGAPTSAAGGLTSEPLSPGGLPSAVGPIGGGMGGGVGGIGVHGVGVGGVSRGLGAESNSAGPLGGSTSSGIRDLTPGTGKFETPTNQPCIGTSGFGSTNVQPGHKC
jgi:hypothetical protein